MIMMVIIIIVMAIEQVIKRLSGKADPPIIGLGHSLGGAAMILLSISRPEIFTRLILYEAPIAPANSPEMVCMLF